MKTSWWVIEPLIPTETVKCVKAQHFCMSHAAYRTKYKWAVSYSSRFASGSSSVSGPPWGRHDILSKIEK